MKWAKFLRSECQTLKCNLFDNTKKSIQENIEAFLNILKLP